MNVIDKSIAKKYLDAIDIRERSWNDEKCKYTIGKPIFEILDGLLTYDEKKSAFAKSIMLFSNWENDVSLLCESILNDE